MNVDEYIERSLEIGRGLNGLLGDMYAAIDEDTPLDEVHKLLEHANHKIEQYESLYSESSEVWRKEMKYDYLSWIDDMRGFKKQLREKYLEKK